MEHPNNDDRLTPYEVAEVAGFEEGSWHYKILLALMCDDFEDVNNQCQAALDEISEQG